MKLIITFILALSALSCSSSNTEKVRYKTSISTPSLEIPPDLTGLNDSENRALPGSKLGSKAAIARYKDTGPLLEKILPKIGGVELKGIGGFHWLEVNKTPTELYTVLKIFWADEGFTLEQDEPLIGIMKTEWLENKAGLVFSGQSTLSRLFSLFESSDAKDQYKTRIERGETEDSSNIYLTQFGQEFVFTEESNRKGWQSRKPEPELEVEMMSRMMLFLGLQDEQVKQQLARIGVFSKRAQLIKSDAGTTLVIKDNLDKSWNKILQQLDRLGVEYISKKRENSEILIRDKEDKENGLFTLSFSRQNLQSGDSNQIAMNNDLGDTLDYATTVNVVASDGIEDNSQQAVALLQYLFENLK